MHRRLLSLWVAGVLLLHLCRGNKEEYEEEYDDYVTPTPDYDYNATFDYIFYSNTSNDVDYSLYEILGGAETTDPNSGCAAHKASRIGWPGPMIFLGLAAHQLW